MSETYFSGNVFYDVPQLESGSHIAQGLSLTCPEDSTALYNETKRQLTCTNGIISVPAEQIGPVQHMPHQVNGYLEIATISMAVAVTALAISNLRRLRREKHG